jgi:hypothetical protein
MHFLSPLCYLLIVGVGILVYYPFETLINCGTVKQAFWTDDRWWVGGAGGGYDMSRITVTYVPACLKVRREKRR